MSKKIVAIFLSLSLCTGVPAQEPDSTSLSQRARTEDGRGNVANARSLYIRAFEDLTRKGQTEEGVECGIRAAVLYHNELLYKESFDLLRRIDQNIEITGHIPAAVKAAMHYKTTRERFQMYMKMRRSANAMDQLNTMERHAAASKDESLRNDLLYNKTIYYYSFGQNDKGNATFKEMAGKLTADKEYDKVDEVYQTLIANGRRSNSASLVAQSYSSYIVWKDSVAALKRADEIGALRQQIADNEASISEKDSSLAARRRVIGGLSVLLAALTAALVLGGIVLLRFIVLTRRQKKTIRLANENNALKAQFISNISAQMEPTLRKLDSSQPEVKALMDFSTHIQTLSALENTDDGEAGSEDIQVAQFCESLMGEIRESVRTGVILTVNAPRMTARINREYVSHIILHLLHNAAEYTPEGGHITLEYKKRSAHKHQFLISNTGSHIPEEKHEDVFKPFLEIRDLTNGDGLGLPICKQMAAKMKGDLQIDSTFTKGTRFVLDLIA